MNRSIFGRVAVALFFLLGLISASMAEPGFPTRPLKVILSTQAGTGSDSAARFFCGQLAIVLAQPCNVENRPGNLSLIGVAAAKAAPADGYTMLLGSNSPMAVNPAMLKVMPYDPVEDFKPIYGLTLHTNVLVVPANSTMKTVADLISVAKQNPNKLNAGIYASLYQLATGWLSVAGSIKVVNVPYKGLPQLTVDLMSGQIDFAFVDLAGIAPLLHAGKLRAIAVLGDRPHTDFPNVPPLKDTLPEMVNYSWTALYIRSGVPADVTARLAEAMAKIITTDAAKDFAKKMNLELLPLGPAAMRTFQIAEIERFKRIGAMANIQKE